MRTRGGDCPPASAAAATAAGSVSAHAASRPLDPASGDLLCDVPLATLLAKHRSSQGAATVLLARRRPSLSPELKLGKAPVGVDYVGLDATKSQLLFCAASRDVRETVRLSRAALRAAGDLCVHSDLMDAQAYVFSPSVLSMLVDRPQFSSLRRDLLPFLVRRQFASERQPPPAPPAPPGEATAQEAGGCSSPPPPTPPSPAIPLSPTSHGGARGLGRSLSTASSMGAGGMGGLAGAAGGCFSQLGGILPAHRKVAVLLADPAAYIVRCDSLKAYLEINRDVACSTEAAHLHALVHNKTNDNYLAPAVELAPKSQVGPGCIVGYAARLAERSSVKRSVLGRRCKLGGGAKVVNSVLHEDVVLEEGAAVQGCVVGRGASVGVRANLRDCQVAPGAVVAAGSEHRSESLQ